MSVLLHSLRESLKSACGPLAIHSHVTESSVLEDRLVIRVHKKMIVLKVLSFVLNDESAGVRTQGSRLKRCQVIPILLSTEYRPDSVPLQIVCG